MNQDKTQKYDEAMRSQSNIESQYRFIDNDRNKLSEEVRKISSENSGLRLRINQVESEKEQLARDRENLGLYDSQLREAGE